MNFEYFLTRFQLQHGKLEKTKIIVNLTYIADLLLCTSLLHGVGSGPGLGVPSLSESDPATWTSSFSTFGTNNSGRNPPRAPSGGIASSGMLGGGGPLIAG